ncbi:hypothetical protein EON81_09595 [bacterium]|nr:MAG: hypothetical protein EON81_09595 [bacterium]
MTSTKKIVAVGLSLSLAGLSFAEENRFNLIDQGEFWANQGFSIALENKTSGSGLLSTDTMKLVFQIGDGKTVRSLGQESKLPVGQDIVLRATITPTEATLRVGDQEFQSPGGYQRSSSGNTKLGETYVWAKSRTAYRVHQSAYHLLSGSSDVRGDASNPVTGQLALFEVPLGKTLTFQGGETVTFETTFRIVAIDSAEMKGAIDRYGQAAAADWPGKIKSDEDLRRSVAEERERTKEWIRPKDWDKYGGLKGVWKEKATGFYRVVKKDEKWWLVSPEGNPLFYTGLCTSPALLWEKTSVTGREAIFQELPPKTGETAKLWADTDPWSGEKRDYYAQHSWNLIRKFGPNWEKAATDEFSRRIGQWGFSGQGKFTDEVPGMPRLETLGLGNVPRLAGHVDVFDPAARKAARDQLAKTVTPLAKEPRILGFSVGNEYEEVIQTAQIREVLEKHKASPAAVAIRKAVKLSDPPTDEEIEKARRFYADAYYAFMYKTVKSLAPNHLYFGYWITPGWWQNDADWDMVVPHCDVLGYDMYTPRYGGPDELAKKLIARFDKPTLVGEFASPPTACADDIVDVPGRPARS